MELCKLSQDTPLLTELPACYGTNTIFLIAQSPHRLFTYWDIDILHHPQGSMLLRCIQAKKEEENIEFEGEIPFEARNWYISVSESGTDYFVELGYYRDNQWQSIAKSSTVQTPTDQMSSSENFDCATHSLHATQLKERTQQCEKNQSLSYSSTATPKLVQSQLPPKKSTSPSTPPPLPENTPAKAAPIPSNAETFSTWTTSALSSFGASPDSSSSWEHGPSNEEIDHLDFFMEVNAEVIFYGKTCPGSSVTIDSHPVDVDKDGNFRYHFIFPEEAYEVPIACTSPDGLETRAAVLRFHRTSSSPSPKSADSSPSENAKENNPS